MCSDVHGRWVTCGWATFSFCTAVGSLSEPDEMLLWLPDINCLLHGPQLCSVEHSLTCGILGMCQSSTCPPTQCPGMSLHVTNIAKHSLNISTAKQQMLGQKAWARG